VIFKQIQTAVAYLIFVLVKKTYFRKAKLLLNLYIFKSFLYLKRSGCTESKRYHLFWFQNSNQEATLD